VRNARTAALVLLALMFATPAAGAADYPAKTMRLIVPYPAGGGIDAVARIFQDKLGDRLGQQIIIESRPGRERSGRGAIRGQGRHAFRIAEAPPSLGSNWTGRCGIIFWK
jgi:tripartite-type tricarboxylate transporter receptor subunit TctC